MINQAADAPPIDGSSSSSVPRNYLGVWRRRILIDKDGNRDESSVRFWLQTADWHADLTLSPARPDFSTVSSLPECSIKQLDWLCRKQQGFAGITRISKDLCHWDRQYDSSLRSTADIGRMRFDANGVHESGVLSKLYEYWERIPCSAKGSVFTTRGQEPFTNNATLLLVCGSYFMYLRDRSTARASLLAIQRRIVEEEAERADLERFADFEMSFGRIEDAHWTILHSTLPWRERKAFCPPSPTAR